MDRVVFGVFDEKFLINFMLPFNAYSVADLLLADKLSSRHELRCGRIDIECLENPGIVRYCSYHEEDLFEIYSQRRRNSFNSDEILRSGDDTRGHDVGADAGFFALSPILKEGADMTIFGDQGHGQGTTLDLFDSPNWLGVNDHAAVSEHFNLTGGKHLAGFPDKNEKCHLESPAFDEFDPSNMLARLSINPEEDSSCLEIMNDEFKQRRQLQIKKSKMKQTTVTFFYDSDEEIDDQSYGSSIPNSRSSRFSKIRAKNALGLIVKNSQLCGKSWDDINKNHKQRGAISMEASPPSIEWPRSSSRTDTISVDAKLEEWISKNFRHQIPQSVIFCDPDSRKCAIKTIIQTSVRATGDGINQNLKKAKIKLFNREGPEKEKNRNLSSLVPSGGMLIVALKDQVEVWASEIRDLSHSRLLLYTDTLAKRRQIGAHNLAQYDVIITTFDILRAKEVCIPEVTQSDSGSDSNKSEQSVDRSRRSDAQTMHIGRGGSLDDSDMDSGSDFRFDSLSLKKFHSENACRENINHHKKKAENVPWMKGRTNNVLLEKSNLHLIHWRRIVVDFNCVTNIRTGTTRGAAIKGLSGECKIGLAGTSTANDQHQRMEIIVMKSDIDKRRGRKQGKIVVGGDDGLLECESDMSDVLHCSGDSDIQEEKMHFSHSNSPVLMKSRGRGIGGEDKSKQNREKKRQGIDRWCLEENIRTVLGGKDGDRDGKRNRDKGIPVFVMGDIA